MSSLDLLREFAESREHDAVLIRDGISYGNVRETLRVMAELEAELQAGRDLMAVVHRDGGDYRQTHGDRKAADDAIAIVSKLRVDLDAERERREEAEALLHAKGEMLFAVVQGAKEEFVRVPYGASHEDVAAINEWHKMAAEALAAWEGDE